MADALVGALAERYSIKPESAEKARNAVIEGVGGLLDKARKFKPED